MQRYYSFILFLVLFVLSCGEENNGPMKYPGGSPGKSIGTIKTDNDDATPANYFDGVWKADFAFITPEMSKRFYFVIDKDNIKMIVKCQITNTNNFLVHEDNGTIKKMEGKIEVKRNSDSSSSSNNSNADSAIDACKAKIENITSTYDYDAEKKIITLLPDGIYPIRLYTTTEAEVIGSKI